MSSIRFLILFFLLFLQQSHCYEQPVVLICGTRPEAIKLIPLYQSLKKANIPTIFCSTGQHCELLDDVFNLFNIKPDYELKIMKPNQDLFYLTKIILEKTEEFFKLLQPNLVVVQGDTTSAMSSALAAFYLKIPVAHVEAGLRSGNRYAPFPEEMNRRVISLLASYHFAPTKHSVINLLKEGIDPDTIFCTGNTIVDALQDVQNKLNTGELSPNPLLVKKIKEQKKQNKKILLLTAHRRESVANGLKELLTTMKTALESHPNLHIFYLQHPNPQIQEIVHKMQLDSISNISIFPPLPYHDLIYLLSHCDAVATDSGGIQEEAASLNITTLVLRNETDRPESSEHSSVLVGTKKENILREIDKIMHSNFSNSITESPFGDGHASEKITEIIKTLLSPTPSKIL